MRATNKTNHIPRYRIPLRQRRNLNTTCTQGDSRLSHILEQCLENNVREVFVCDQNLPHPPLSHFVAFPRLEIPLKGCYETKIESNGRIKTIKLRPGTALFSAPNSWNLPAWQHDLTLISILFGKDRIGISIVTCRASTIPKLVAQKMCLPFPAFGPLPHILQAANVLQSRISARPALAKLSMVLVHFVCELIENSDCHLQNRPRRNLRSGRPVNIPKYFPAR